MRRVSFIPLPDPFLLCLIAVVTAASLLPVRGSAASWVELLADMAIALLFFLHGAKLSRAAILQGIGNWRLHLLVLASTYVLFPAAGLAAAKLSREWIDPVLVTGVVFLTLLPSTVQSSIAFTAMARGNVAAAVCSASLSNLLGIVLTPLLVGVFIRAGAAGKGFDWHAVEGIVLQLLVPFLAGHLLRPVIGGFVDRNRKILMPVDRGSILLVVYSAFSAAVVNGIWRILDWSDLGALLLVCAVILAVVMAINLLAVRLARVPREDGIVLLFCGSKKSLVSGVPMAGALFAPAQVGMIVLPLMIFHQLQLFVCAWLAARFARQDDVAGRGEAVGFAQDEGIPRAPEEIAAVAAGRGLWIPAPCMQGVAANLELLARHAERLRGAPDAGTT
jgi:sodium/bile acid cotransporter 7